MPHVTTDDRIGLYYEEAGSGTAVVFVHEFLGELRSWEAQLRYFSRRYRCIAYNARGYPPSDVPDEPDDYSFEHQRSDLRAVLDGLGLDRAHLVGLSMGAFAAFYFGMRWPERALSLTLAGIGSGSPPEVRAAFARQADAAADALAAEGWPANAQLRGLTPTRVQLQNKNPRAFVEFIAMLEQHSANGSELTLRGYQARRTSVK